jgi:hypothetical protein
MVASRDGAKTHRLGDIRRPDDFIVREIGDGSCHAKHAVEGTRG